MEKGSQSSSGAEDESEMEEDWGSKAKGYYGGDYVDPDFELNSEDEEQARMEEEEVKRLEQKRAAELEEEDFGLEALRSSAGKVGLSLDTLFLSRYFLSILSIRSLSLETLDALSRYSLSLSRYTLS